MVMILFVFVQVTRRGERLEAPGTRVRPLASVHSAVVYQRAGGDKRFGALVAAVRPLPGVKSFVRLED